MTLDEQAGGLRLPRGNGLIDVLVFLPDIHYHQHELTVEGQSLHPMNAARDLTARVWSLRHENTGWLWSLPRPWSATQHSVVALKPTALISVTTSQYDKQINYTTPSVCVCVCVCAHRVKLLEVGCGHV